MSAKVVDRDRGYAALMKRLKAEKITLTVGVHEAEASEPHDGELTIGDLAAIHEFGLGHVPERSFLRAWADESVEENKNVLGDIGRAVAEGKYDLETGLDRFGVYAVGAIQRRIVEGIEPPLADETIKRKGSSTPLIDTGQLKSAITFEVKKGGSST
jgi:hypothetical protein